MIKLTRKEKMERKSELLKKHNDKLKESSKDTEIEEKVKVPPLDLDLSDDSIKKPSLFDSINKSKTSSEDGNENKSEKSDQYDTVFEGNGNIVRPDEVEPVSYDNRAYENGEDTEKYETVDQDHTGEVYEFDNQPDTVKDASNKATGCVEGLKTVEANVTQLDNDCDTTIKRGDDSNSVTDVKVTDLDSDSDDSTQGSLHKEQNEVSLNY